jgi:hypothetical protein
MKLPVIPIFCHPDTRGITGGAGNPACEPAFQRVPPTERRLPSAFSELQVNK